ncbi:uncharacterized protein LOC108667234 [Hyalella azteca]|uniref:Uncharacterized protein LOC108667234 n=1 Tax=Hyalella azteca TaxID=294128 RepID=A0A8B7N8W1_HYAAZ|nr:uncharacterized protein LOC108667234 [Hyalella azteca]
MLSKVANFTCLHLCFRALHSSAPANMPRTGIMKVNNWGINFNCWHNNLCLLVENTRCISGKHHMEKVPQFLSTSRSNPYQSRSLHSQTASKPKLDMKILNESLRENGKVLFTHNNGKESVIYNILAFGLCGFLTYMGYIIYTSEDYEVIEDRPSTEDFHPFYQYLNFNPLKPYIASAFLAAGVFTIGAIMNHSLRCVRSLTLLPDGLTVMVTTNSFSGAARTRQVPRMQLRTEKLNYLLGGYDSCRLHRQGQRLSYIMDVRGTVHDPRALASLFSHSNDFAQVPESERVD